MASNKQLTELFRAIATENFGGAIEVAAQICRHEEELGHHTAARMLRGALNASRKGGASRVDQPLILNGSGVISTALSHVSIDTSLSEVTLPVAAREEIEGLVVEWKHRDRLHELGIARRSKCLFYGPPGCGKSLTAKALAGALGLPLFLVRFDAVIGAYLGQTAVHLRQLFNFSESTPSVILFDELDALGKRRGNARDVGELDRVVIALMQELEHASPLGVIVATSNLADHLDEALRRRFDFSLEFAAPNSTQLTSFACQLASTMNLYLSDDVLVKITQANNFADAKLLVVAEARKQALQKI